MNKIFEDEGLVFIGSSDLDVGGDAERFSSWLQQSFHGEMRYLEKHGKARSTPQFLLDPHATFSGSALVFGFSYDQGDRYYGRNVKKPLVAQYARLKDYHKFMVKRGRAVAERIFTTGQLHKVCVDSAPVFERALARKTGVGFIGKNSCWIWPGHGSFYLLGTIISEVSAEFWEHSSKNKTSSCGTCRRCQVHCPTDALTGNFTIDSRLCLSYWTIEHRGAVPQEFWPWFKDYWYGCDICQLVCPFNRSSKAATIPEELRQKTSFDLYEVATMDQGAYERMFGGSAMTRAKRTGLMRNALIAMYVTSDERLNQAMEVVKNSDDLGIQETLRQMTVTKDLSTAGQNKAAN